MLEIWLHCAQYNHSWLLFYVNSKVGEAIVGKIISFKLYRMLTLDLDYFYVSLTAFFFSFIVLTFFPNIFMLSGVEKLPLHTSMD